MRHQSAVLAQLIARFTGRVFGNPKMIDDSIGIQ